MAFELRTRVGIGTDDPEVCIALALGFLRGVIAGNRIILQQAAGKGRPVPPLYNLARKERVVWLPEPWAGKFEEFADILTVMRRGWGDCDDLVAWRCAELQESGEDAQPAAHARKRRGQRFWKIHVKVRREDGTIEDPSRMMGM